MISPPYFYTPRGQVTHLLDYTKEILSQFPDSKIHIGTDSKTQKGKTLYVTVVAFHSKGGVRYLLNKSTISHKPHSDKSSKLWSILYEEINLTLKVASWLAQRIQTPIQVDMDFNQNPIHYSNRLIPVAKSIFQGTQFSVKFKPDSLLATRAADYHCNHPGNNWN